MLWLLSFQVSSHAVVACQKSLLLLSEVFSQLDWAPNRFQTLSACFICGDMTGSKYSTWNCSSPLVLLVVGKMYYFLLSHLFQMLKDMLAMCHAQGGFKIFLI